MKIIRKCFHSFSAFSLSLFSPVGVKPVECTDGRPRGRRRVASRPSVGQLPPLAASCPSSSHQEARVPLQVFSLSPTVRSNSFLLLLLIFFFLFSFLFCSETVTVNVLQLNVSACRAADAWAALITIFSENNLLSRVAVG